MIRIPFEEDRLEPAKTAHIKAILNYVKSKDDSYQQKLYDNISKITPFEDEFQVLKKNNNWGWLSSFLLADVNTLKSWISQKDLLQFDEFKKLYSTKFCNGASVYVDNQTKYNAYSYCNYLNITVCPYCDEEYLDVLIKEGEKPIRTLEIDHFYPKSDYPALAMCFYNLVPSGQNCNGIKLNKLLGMNPYEGDIEACTHLYPDFPIGMNMSNVKIADCTIKFHPIGKMTENVEILGLEERYERHKGTAYKYIKNMQLYSEEKIDELVRMGAFPSKEMAYCDLFDVPLLDDTEQKLLTKLRRDIVGK